MSSIEVRLLEKPSDTELDDASQVLAKAFEKDVFVASCIGGDQSLNIAFQRATIAAAAVAGKVYVASYEDIKVAGVAAWFGPGRGLLDSPDQGEAGYNALLASFPPELMKWWMEYFLPKYNAQTTSALGEGVKLGAWHLQMFGVLPECQGKGVGSSLMTVMESKAFAEGKTLCLETDSEHNVKMYEHWGYALKGKDDYESSTGGFTLYILEK
ncbi:acyl-CoA N-acyltransferase [Neolentinus lepideus HHB14362 ss-1]|uniref:Acyl-CoA N-acyltransferase n=1 Tax=Neolentinus lepideus HHB14362 ss-1 TaxID=1314782 RepID=A0A165UX69_9AGAM|nr:acyl-CoA N-acyltransferase [Neolentinus lepideus HHB14362 ss-1]